MKFLNEIDGASKLKQDSSNRLVTDVQKASWNSKAEGNHNHSKNEITDFPTSLPASGGQSTTTEHLVGDDTRSVNSPPSVYMSSGSRWAGRAGWQTEFKYRSTIGSPSSLSGTYVYLQTHTPWSDPSGGYPVQIAYGNGAPSWRVGVSDSTWSDWESFNDNGNAATVNGKTVLTDVPTNAKFTDTTYTEITTAEIDTGTASTLRTITGRRVKYILDKVQGWIGGLTKSDVGLSNVDNIKQMPISGGILENYREKLVTLSGTSTAINLSLGNVFTHSLTGNTTYTITNAVNSQAHSFTLIITQTAIVRTLTFPASVKWQGGEIPDMSETNKTYVLTFMTVDGGANWLGMFGGEF